VSSTQYGQPHETLYLINGDNGEVSSHPETRSLRSDNIEILCRENKYLVGPSDFFQVNRYLLSKMLEVVIDNESGALALDLYCGIGFFSIPLAKCFHHVIAVENNPHSVHLGRLNALKNNSTSIEFFIDSVEKWLFNYKENHKKIDFVLVDPPRVGLSRKIIHGISKLKSKRLTYVSCNPTTLARDLKHLLSIGYDITSIEAVDLFPQTFHIETIVKLVHH
jgi:23S rRNA (uracil1939-C5)-methyltransferase